MMSLQKRNMEGQEKERQSAMNTGASTSPAMGTCTARMKAIAFLILSKMRRPPRRMAAR